MKLPFTKYKRRQINLLPRNDFEGSFLGVFLGWVLAFGKWAVIITQLVVVSVFITRFWYDRKLTDLRKEIAKQATIIRAYEPIENDYVLAERRVTLAGTVLDEQAKLTTVIEKLQQNTPADLWFQRLSISPTSATLMASANSLTGFSQFVRTMTADPLFNSVTITNLTDGASSGARLQFNMTINYGPEKSK